MAKEDKKNTGRLPGFYIALCCCVLVIGIAGYFTERKGRETTTDATSGFSENVITGSVIDENKQEPDGEVLSVSEVTPMEESTPTAAPATDAPQATQEPEYTKDNPDVMETAVRVEPTETVFSFPAGGKILAPYSAVLSFNQALGDYRTHNGIDIAADEGCSISASADGTVEDVFSDAFGEGISLTHANGMMTKYMCLGAVENLKTGDTVKAGDVIGTVGKSKGENTEAPHLHFELYKDGQPVNPEDYLK